MSKDASTPRRRGRAGRLLFAALTLGLAGFNGWWYWRDSRPIAHTAAVEKLIGRRQYDEALAALRERLRRAPDDGDARIGLARVLAAKNDLAGCARELRLVPVWWPRKAEAGFREGSVWMMLDRARDAEAAWLDVIKDDPLHPAPSDVFHDTTLELLKLYATEDRWEDGVNVLWRAYGEVDATDRATLVNWRLRSELERVTPTEAVVSLRKYAAADPGDVEALRALARAEQVLGQPDVARAHFGQCLKIAPRNPRVWRDYLNLLHEVGDQEAFAAALAKLPAEADTEAEVWKFRGIARETSGDLNGAAEAYRAAIERTPNLVEYHHRLGSVEERLGHKEIAAEHRKRSKELRDARAQLSQAFAEYVDARNGRVGKGPDLPTSIENLAVVCQALGWTRVAQALNEM